MCPSFSLCACRILKIRSCLRSPLAPGSSKVLAILVSSVMFFSFNSAMVMICPRKTTQLNPCTKIDSLVASGDFQKEGIRGRQQTPGRRTGLLKQPVVVPQQNSPAPTERPAAPRPRSGLAHHSSFPGFWCWAGGTSAWPWRRAGITYNDSATSVKRQTHDQSACLSYSFLISMGISLSPLSPSSQPEPKGRPKPLIPLEL